MLSLLKKTMKALFLTLVVFLESCQKMDTEYFASADKKQGEVDIHLIVSPPVIVNIRIPDASIDDIIKIDKSEISIWYVHYMIKETSKIYITINKNTKIL